MDKAEEIYQQLTGVDLDMQRRIWDERGKGYYGEYLVFRELLFRVPGSSKILMNLQVPTTTAPFYSQFTIVICKNNNRINGHLRH